MKRKFDKPLSNSNLAERKHFSITVYTADAWEHVCPVVRITGPARQAGIHVIHGNECADTVRPNGSQAPRLRVYPERVADGDLVVIRARFSRPGCGKFRGWLASKPIRTGGQ